MKLAFNVRATSDTVMPVQQPVFGGHWSLDDFFNVRERHSAKIIRKTPTVPPASASPQQQTSYLKGRVFDVFNKPAVFVCSTYM